MFVGFLDLEKRATIDYVEICWVMFPLLGDRCPWIPQGLWQSQ